MVNPPNSKKFKDNYAILKETAAWLSKPGEADIDELVPKVEKAMQAYRECKSRLEEVRNTLDRYFEDKAVNGGAKEGDGQADDDLPF